MFIRKSCLFDRFGSPAQLSPPPSSSRTPGWFDYSTDKNYEALGSVQLQWGPPLYAFNVTTDMNGAKEDPNLYHGGVASGHDTFWVLPDDVPFDILVGREFLHT
jgi:hypothetical protein